MVRFDMFAAPNTPTSGDMPEIGKTGSELPMKLEERHHRAQPKIVERFHTTKTRNRPCVTGLDAAISHVFAYLELQGLADNRRS